MTTRNLNINPNEKNKEEILDKHTYSFVLCFYGISPKMNNKLLNQFNQKSNLRFEVIMNLHIPEARESYVNVKKELFHIQRTANVDKSFISKRRYKSILNKTSS